MVFGATHDVANVEPYEGVLREVEVAAHGEAGVLRRSGISEIQIWILSFKFCENMRLWLWVCER